MNPPAGADEAVQTFEPAVRPIARQLRKLVRAAAPTAEERWASGWESIVYKRGRDFCYIAARRDYVNLGFFKAAGPGGLDDPAGLLEGTGKSMRHVKVRALDAKQELSLAALVRQAYERARRS